MTQRCISRWSAFAALSAAAGMAGMSAAEPRGDDALQPPEQLRLTIPLEADGTWTVSDFVMHLKDCLPGGRTPIAQDLPAGTVLAGPQVVVIELDTIDADGFPQDALHLELVLRDVTPPTIELAVETTGPVRQRPGMTPFIVAPAAAAITVDVVDTVDTSPLVEVVHNGAVATMPIIVDEIGLHRVTVRATDASGNVQMRSTVLQLRPRDFRPAVAVVESLDVIDIDGAVEHIELTVLLGADEFNPWGIHLGATQVIVLDEAGDVMAQPTSIRGVDICWEPGELEPATFYDPATVDAKFVNGHWRLGFSIPMRDKSDLATPASVLVVGRSAVTRADDFDFLATTSATPSDDPVRALAATGADPSWPNPGLLPHPGTPPGDPPIQCEWRFELHDWESDQCVAIDQSASDCGFLLRFRQHAVVLLSDPVAAPSGQGEAVDNSCPGNAAASCSIATSGKLLLWLSPTPPCTECVMTVRARPRLDMAVSINPPAKALAAGYIAVNGSGINTMAGGGVALGANQPTNIIVGPEWSIPISIGSGESLRRTFASMTAAERSFPGCVATLEIGSGAHMDVLADGFAFPIGDLYGHATASIFNAGPRIRMTGIVTEGPCRGMRRVANYH